MAGLDCARSMAAAGANGRASRSATLSRTLRGGPRILARLDLLAMPTASDPKPRLASSLGLSRHLRTDLCRTDAHRCASLFDSTMACGAGCLDWLGTGPRARSHRFFDG